MPGYASRTRQAPKSQRGGAGLCPGARIPFGLGDIDSAIAFALRLVALGVLIGGALVALA